MNVGVSLYNDKKYKEAAEAFGKVAAAEPYNRDALFNLTNTYFALKDGPKLLETAQRLSELEPMNEILRAGARDGGYAGEIPAHETELASLQALTARANPGDVCAVMAHVERSELFEWLEGAGFKAVDVDGLRGLSRA